MIVLIGLVAVNDVSYRLQMNAFELEFRGPHIACQTLLCGVTSEGEKREWHVCLHSLLQMIQQPTVGHKYLSGGQTQYDAHGHTVPPVYPNASPSFGPTAYPQPPDPRTVATSPFSPASNCPIYPVSPAALASYNMHSNAVSSVHPTPRSHTPTGYPQPATTGSLNSPPVPTSQDIHSHTVSPVYPHSLPPYSSNFHPPSQEAVPPPYTPSPVSPPPSTFPHPVSPAIHASQTVPTGRTASDTLMRETQGTGTPLALVQSVLKLSICVLLRFIQNSY